MKTVTLRIDDAISDKFAWLLEHFSPDEVRILEQGHYVDDDTYLRGIEGMIESIHEARNEPMEKGVSTDQLEW